MSSRASKIASSLKQLGEIQVNDWDFMSLLNTDIEELEITRSLRRLGQVQVTDWDFKDVLPAVRKAANQEVDVINILKRTANYKVMEWDFRNLAAPEPAAGEMAADAAVLQEVTLKLKNFLEYVVVNLIQEPKHAQIKVSPLKPTGLRFKLVMVKKDVALLIGRDGQTAAAIRNLMKSTAREYGVEVLLNIHSHEEEALLVASGRADS